ncbi:MAG: hypothetical protein IPO35_15725 [Uliginosibacterium sp.]|nr:hypothetical protein [Uliginosibacterium sp.]
MVTTVSVRRLMLFCCRPPLPVRAADYDFPDMSTYEVGTDLSTDQAINLSNALLRTATTGEFMSDAADGVVLATDWVFSQPTRRYHVAGRGGVYAFGSNATVTSGLTLDLTLPTMC